MSLGQTRSNVKQRISGIISRQIPEAKTTEPKEMKSRAA
jgi:hypothetical protein